MVFSGHGVTPAASFRIRSAMHETFPITEVKTEWVLEPEEMGSKRKFWYGRSGEQSRRWLFKYPQTGTGQHWAEKIAAEIAGVLGIPRAEVELAVFTGEQGSITKSFVINDLELVHGNQILSAYVLGYNPEKKFHQADHSIANVFSALDRVFVENVAKQKAKALFAEYMILDALIGNTDRHHENWGVLRRRKDDEWDGFLAPSFDHASSLGRELRDDRRERRLAETRIGAYLESGRGAVYWSADDARGPSPLELVRRASRVYPELFRRALEKIDRIEDDVDNLLRRMPDGWMSPFEMKFASEMVHYSLGQLREVRR